MRIDHVSQPYRAEFAKQIDAAKRKTESSATAKGDSVKFSQDGKLLSETRSAVEVTKVAVQNAPQVRPEKVAEVKERISTGYYNSPEFAERLADKLISDIGKELGIR